MNYSVRTFEDKPAIREHVPLLIGLMGPTGSGKTFSALRLATGIQTVTRGDIFVIDTEARRARHYADQFKFRHIQFDAPFGSLDYLAAIQHCVAQGARVVIIDSMSHEHTMPGGYLLTQAAEIDRMAGDDYAKRERVKMAAWIKPAAMRQQMINGILQLNANFIFCFRAKEKTKPVKGGGVLELGYMPIGGEDFLFEMTVNCLLLPRSDGVPTWQSENVGELQMMKLPIQFKSIFAEKKPLDETIGRALAEWARGSEKPSSHQPRPPAPTKEPAAGPSAPSLTAAGTLSLEDMAREAARRGEPVFKAFYKSRSDPEKKILNAMGDELRGLMNEMVQ